MQALGHLFPQMLRLEREVKDAHVYISRLENHRHPSSSRF